MEVQSEEEDLGLILLCSLPSFYTNFIDTILYSRDTLTLNEVYEALHSKEKMKQMVSQDGSSSSQAEGLSVRGRTKDKIPNNGNRDKSSNGYRGRYKSCKYCKKDGHDISECYRLQNKEKQKNNSEKENESDGQAAVVTKHQDYDGNVLVASTYDADTGDDWILDSACSFHMSPCREWFSTLVAVKMAMILRAELKALALFGSRCLMASLEHCQMFVIFLI
jgi:hypothetical protein